MRKAILLLAVLAIPVPAFAGKCSWNILPTNITFGNYSVFKQSTDLLTGTGNYEIMCVPNTQATITFSVGANSSTYLPRYLANGTYKLPYNVYDDSAMSTIMGDGTGGTTARQAFNSTPKDKVFNDPYYAKIAQGGDVRAGTYTDTVTVNVSWAGGSISGSFTVTTIVLAECSASSLGLDFKNYDPIVANAIAPLDSYADLQIFCTMNTPITVTLSNGLNYSGSTRQMSGPFSSLLEYALYSDSARTTSWTSVPATSTSKTTPIGLRLYGRVRGGQDPAAGKHTDTVVATVNY